MLTKSIKYGLYLILAQSFALFCAAQTDLPGNSVGEIQFYVDETSFYNNGKVYEEFYIMVYVDQLKLTPKNNSQYANLSLSATIKKGSGEYLYKDSWETEAKVIHDSTNVGGMVIYDQWSQVFEPGIYKLEMEVTDNIGGKRGTVRKEFKAEVQSNDTLFLSEIEFASKINPHSNSENIFNKGTVTVIPNPSRRYGVLNPLLYFYYEVYDPQNNKPKNLDISYEIEALDGTSLRSFDKKTVSLSDANSGIPNGLNVSAVASGIYYLVIKAEDSATGYVTETRRAFEVIQMDYMDKSPVFTQEQADMFGEIIRLIGTSKEYELYERLNLTSKAKFLVQFWRQNDPSPSTDENELFNRIIQRYQYANEKFSWAGLEGWKSDRGKVLIKNGMPDNIERYPSEESTFPYEIWEYQSRRSYIYVFGDLRNNGRYTLLHSNKEGEIYNPYWKEELNRM